MAKAKTSPLSALVSQDNEEPAPRPVSATAPKLISAVKKSETRKHIGGYFDHATAKRLGILKAETGKSTQDLLAEALELLFAHARTNASFKD